MTAAVIGLDVGGTFMKGVVLAPDGATALRRRFPTPRADGPEAVSAAIVSALDDLRGEAARELGIAVERAGVAVPGVVDEARGHVVFSAPIGWRATDLAACLEAGTGLTIALGHDVASAGYAEARLGAARGYEDVLVVPIGTGIAAAVISEGRLLRSGGYSGQIGHLVIEPGGYPCGCGNYGCLGTIASAAAIARRYTERSGIAVDGAVEVAEKVRAEDPTARLVWDEAVAALATALAHASTLIAPEVIVIGGGLAQSGELLLAPLRQGIASRLTFQRLPEVVGAQLGDEAGSLGAALLALGYRARTRRSE